MFGVAYQHTNFCSLDSFMRTVESADLSEFLKYEK